MLVLLIILTAVLCRQTAAITSSIFIRSAANYLRTCLYISLFILWGMSLKYRIISKQIRRFLSSAAALMVFWMIVRTLKFYVFTSPQVLRILWYVYYFPMLLIPLLSYMGALLLGKDEDYRLSKGIWLLIVPTCFLIFMVLTNDLHQLVFSFPYGDRVWSEQHYAYGPFYYIILGWLLFLVVGAYATMVVKYHRGRGKKHNFAPVFPLAAAFVYAYFYLFRPDMVMDIFGDLAIVFCLFFMWTLESCIASGLIQTNTDYEVVFRVNSLGARITDRQFKTIYRAANSLTISPYIMKKALRKPFRLDRNTLIKCHSIKKGYVVWQEDMSELTEIIETLQENNRELREVILLEEENLKTEIKIQSLKEKNRLLDQYGREIIPRLKNMKTLFESYEQASSERKQALAAELLSEGSYIKRTSNLFFIGKSGETTALSELGFSLREYFKDLEYRGIEGGLSLSEDEKIYVDDAIEAYDIIRKLVNDIGRELSCLWVSVTADGDRLKLCLEAESKKDLLAFYRKQKEDRKKTVGYRKLSGCRFEKGERENEIYRFFFSLRRAGE